jgi:hypothetical protein
MRCPACPVAPGRECYGERDHPPACGYVAAGRVEWAEHLRRMAGELPPAPDPGRVDVRLAMLAETCPHGSGPCGCGALPRDCSRPDRPDKVWRRDCLACVAEGSP